MEKPFALITFNSRNHVPGARRLLLDGGIDSAVMPTPRALTAACGLALRVRPEDLPAAAQMLADRYGPQLTELYDAQIEDGGRPVYSKADIKWQCS